MHELYIYWVHTICGAVKFCYGCNSFLLSDRTRCELKRRSMNDHVPIYIRVKKQGKNLECVDLYKIHIYVCIYEC